MLGVVCPALTERIGPEMPPDIVGGAIRMQVLQEVAGPDFVNRDCKQVGFAGNVREPVFLGPVRIRWRFAICSDSKMQTTRCRSMM